MRKIALRGAAFVTASAALMAMGAEAPASASSVTFLPTCQAIHNARHSAPDGEYLLLNNGNILSVYCGGMSTTPRSYIDLSKTGTNVNFSQYTAGGASPGTNVRTSFTKVGIDPATLQADIGDLAFASSTGSLKHSGGTTVTSMAYGVAMACIAPGNAAGVANINLTGTAFKVTSTFATGGSSSAGTATVSRNHQVVNLTGGGFCGWMMSAPALFNPFNPSPGMYHLQLACSTTLVNRQICFSLPRRAAVTQQGRQWNGRPAVTVREHGRTLAVVGPNGRVLS
jgi:GON domain